MTEIPDGRGTMTKQQMPVGCVCPPDEWTDWVTLICPKYSPSREHEGCCANCQHDEACHAKAAI